MPDASRLLTDRIRACESGLSILGGKRLLAVAVKFDNRPTWSNAPKFDNRPGWDNWNKK
jgi:hypothetical protein